MSRPQTALHAMPPGTVVTRALFASTAALNRILDAERLDEVARAKSLQLETGCTWPEAIRAVVGAGASA